MPATTAKPAPVPVLVVPPALVDEFAQLAALREDFAPTEAKYQAARRKLALLVADADPDAQFNVAGEDYTLLISECGFVRKLDIPAVRKALGAATFLEVASVSMAELANWMLKPQIEALCISEQTGPRKFVAAPKS